MTEADLKLAEQEQFMAQAGYLTSSYQE